MNRSTHLLRTINDLRVVLDALEPLADPLARAADAVQQALLGGNKLLICGNGGSAADAAHIATEFVVRLSVDRPAYPAIALGDSGSTLTAAGNDFGFSAAFARQVEAFGRQGDVFIGLSTSGNSANVIHALRSANERGLVTIALLGGDGGQTRGLAHIELLVPVGSTARIQEAHQLLLHTLCEIIDPALAAGPDLSTRR